MSAENAKTAGVNGGQGDGAGMGSSYAHDSTSNAGLLSLEHHIGERDSAQLLIDLRDMDNAPPELDTVLQARRRLTVQALRNRGAE